MGFDVGQQVLAVPGVVAEREHVGTGGEQGVGHVGRQAEAVAGIFGVYHHQIQGQGAA